MESGIKIDIMTDSVCDIQAKLFFKATDGKTMRNAWEAPMPASLQVLTNDQVKLWGKDAMKCTSCKVAANPRRRGSRRVSAMENYAQRSSAKPFHGYRSEPAKAKAFKFADPVGPVATAIKAAGELAAIAESKGESDAPIWGLLRGSWGVSIDAVKPYVKPDLSEASEKDIIKFIRSPSHMLYGFNNHAPSVTTSLGRYRPETMTQNFLFDWHSFSLALRFQGEYVTKYQGGFPRVGMSIAYGPAYAEGNPYVRTITTEHMEPSDFVGKAPVINDIVNTTMKHYEGEMAQYGVRSSARLASSKAKVSDQIDIDIAVINHMALSRSTADLHLPRNMTRVIPDGAGYDIKEISAGKFHRSLDNSAVRFGSHYIPTWRSVHCLMWEQFFRTGGDKANEMRSIARLKDRYLAMEVSAQDTLKKRLVSCIPIDFGQTLFIILNMMSPSTNKAVIEFFDMLHEVSNTNYIARNKEWSRMYLEAVDCCTDLNVILKFVNQGINRHCSYIHSSGKITIPMTPGLSTTQNFLIGITNFSRERIAYWSSHYASRIVDYRDTLRRIDKIGKRRGLEWTDIIMAYPKMNNMMHDMNSMSDETVIKYHSGCRYGVIIYAYLEKCYRNSIVTVDDKFNVTVSIKPGAYANMMESIARKYVNKRSNGRNTEISRAIDSICNQMRRLTRHTDINRLLDSKLDPSVKWENIYAAYKKRAEVTSNSVTRTLKARISNVKDAVNVIEKEIHEEMEVAVVSTINEMKTNYYENNPYSILQDDSEDDDYDSATDDESNGVHGEEERKVEDFIEDDDTYETITGEAEANTKDDMAAFSPKVDSAKESAMFDDLDDDEDPFNTFMEDDDLFGDDEANDVDYGKVSLANYIVNAPGVKFDEFAFSDFIKSKYDAIDDVMLPILELDSVVAEYSKSVDVSGACIISDANDDHENIDIV